MDGGSIGWSLLALLGIAVLYRAIRTAVAHGVADAEEKRRKRS
ncbi:GlyGly-CTERM sorting domain-containing protein [Actinoplanes sp. CA-054009]